MVKNKSRRKEVWEEGIWNTHTHTHERWRIQFLEVALENVYSPSAQEKLWRPPHHELL